MRTLAAASRGDCGRRRCQRCTGSECDTAEPGGSAVTWVRMPRRTSSPRMRRPALRYATEAGMTMRTRPPGAVCAYACCNQASSPSAREGVPSSQRESSSRSSRPQSVSPTGGSHTTKSALRSVHRSSRRESPVTISTRVRLVRSARSCAYLALRTSNSCPHRLGPCWGPTASSRVPIPHAGSKSVAPTSTSPAKCLTARTIRGEVTWSDPALRTDSVKRSASAFTTSPAERLSTMPRTTRTASSGSASGAACSGSATNCATSATPAIISSP